MYASSRRNKIVELLSEKSELSVSELSSYFSVSEVTIRKDLSLLESKGALIRTFGGAVTSETAPIAMGRLASAGNDSDIIAHTKIARRVSGIIKEEDFIFLGPGFTCLEVAKGFVGRRGLTVVTTNVSAAIELADAPEIKIIIPEGDFIKRNGTYYVTGQKVMDCLKGMYFDKALFTVDGASVSRGFSVLDEITSEILSLPIANASQVIICATVPKFKKNAMAKLGPLSIASRVVTDAKPPEEFCEAFNGQEITLSFQE